MPSGFHGKKKGIVFFGWATLHGTYSHKKKGKKGTTGQLGLLGSWGSLKGTREFSQRRTWILFYQTLDLGFWILEFVLIDFGCWTFDKEGFLGTSGIHLMSIA